MVDFKKLNKSLKKNIEIKNLAKELKSALEEYDEDEAIFELSALVTKITELEGSNKARFWDSLFSEVVRKLGTGIKDHNNAMSYEEAQKFSEEKVPYGKYQGKRVIDLETDYIDWLCAQDNFQSNLNKYAGSQYYLANHENK